ncbi:MAG: 4Fe-4S binding protein [Caldimicrobium sp.]
MKIFKIRRTLQIASSLLHNSYFGFISTGSIYTGTLKRFCGPGLNCYSCPAAIFSCPLGSLQQIMISLKILPWNMLSQAILYTLGNILLLSLFLGRFICGWLCPFGFFQDLLYKIPFLKKRITLPFNLQKYLKYFFLLFLVFLFPALFIKEIGYGILWFCKYICPAGTLEAGYLNLLINPSLLEKIGLIFFLKSFLLLFILLLCLADLRFFCKNLCPLGVIYGFFNKIGLFRLHWKKHSCNVCGICEKVCPMNLSIPKDLNSLECIRCLNCLSVCPSKAIGLEKSILFLPEKYSIAESVSNLKNMNIIK